MGVRGQAWKDGLHHELGITGVRVLWIFGGETELKRQNKELELVTLLTGGRFSWHERCVKKWRGFELKWS